MMRMTWNMNGQAYDQVKAASWEGIRRAAAYYWDRLQDALNVPNSGVDVPLPWGGTKRVYPNPSKPGDPPRKVTGFGAGNVVVEYDQPNLKARVGVTQNAKYMVVHELGGTTATTIVPKKGKALMWYDFAGKQWLFRKRVVKPPAKKRPWLVATLLKFFPQIQALAGKAP